MELFNNNNIFFSFATHFISSFHSLQGENCDSNSRLVVDKNDNGKFRLERVNLYLYNNFVPSSLGWIWKICRQLFKQLCNFYCDYCLYEYFLAGCGLKILQLLQHFEHLASPMAQGIELFTVDYGMKSMVPDIMRWVLGGKCGQSL